MFPFIWWLQGGADPEAAAAQHEGGSDFFRRRAILSSPEQWKPRQGLIGWYDATFAASASLWLDKSGRNSNMVTAGADPAYSATGWNSAKPALVFTPDQQLRTTGPVRNDILGGPGFSVLAVVDTNNSGDAKFLLQWTDEAVTFMAVQITAGGLLRIDDNTAGSVSGTLNAEGRRTLAVAIGGGSVSTWVNRSPDLVNEAFAPVLSASNYLAIGVNANGVNGFNGAISEILIFNHKVTDRIVGLFNAYAREKWGGLS
ncbi:MAG TPA: hypothetical protein VGK73_28000 [Polyangiaceae bacterium]